MPAPISTAAAVEDSWTCLPPSIYTSTRIAAPASAVYPVLMDGPDAANWNPFITEANFTASSAVGDELDLVLGDGFKAQPRVSVNEKDRAFEWYTPSCCFSARHIFEFEEATEPQSLSVTTVTHFVHREAFGGFLAYACCCLLPCLLPCLLTGPTTAKFGDMNRALKEREAKYNM
jgi:hypothetical protein